ncbi:hypothetical protein Bca4012_027077 [Brassica carinata]|uniref:Uncharacterized protein n=1 Tax=Brassica carinata TaxID=52824 RepID=A0A8X7VJR0_BRACI|nr:hypothetical protein Bca52824_024084 [Brassica carinata]
MPTVAMEEVSKQIRETEATVGGFDNQVKFLTGGCQVLSETSTAAYKTLDSVESNLQTLGKSIEQLTTVVLCESSNESTFSEYIESNTSGILMNL